MTSKQLNKEQIAFFGLFGLISILSMLAAMHTEFYPIAAVPIILLIAGAAAINIRFVYFFLLFLLPLSIEFEVTNSLRTDFPTEPVMGGLMLVTLAYLGYNINRIDLRFFSNPLNLLVALHYSWILVVVINSPNQLVSWKYFLAKSWYITTFFVLTGLAISNFKLFKKAFWVIMIPLTAMVLQTMVRHGLVGFSFEDVNTQMWPFFRNHVTYAGMITAFLPFIFLARTWYEKGTFKRRFLNWMIILYLIAIYLSFTRACTLALAVAAVTYFIIKWNLLRQTLVVSVIVVAIGFNYLASNHRYLALQPDYKKTVHHEDFDDHMLATFQGQDASSMERLNMWVAGILMAPERPIFGYGPGNFYPTYKSYTVPGFHTYLSENEDGLTVHNYFILMLVEQGYIGLGIFVLLTLAIFWYGQNLYRRAGPEHKGVVMAILLCMVIIYVNLLLSDLVETDKIGSLYFICIALLINVSIWVKDSVKSAIE